MTVNSMHPDGARREEVGQEKPPESKLLWPLAIALLNLTGLGLGYLYASPYRGGRGGRHWLRWLVHFLVTGGLIAIVFLTNGARLPGLWLALFGLWLAWMAFDGWRQARRMALAAPAGTSRHRWLPALVAVLVLVLEIAGFWGYCALGQREFAQGMAAYWAADCRTAMQHFDRVTAWYELTLSPSVNDADAMIVECSLLVFGDSARGRGDHATAVDAYEAYLHRHPESVLVIFARETLAETYSEWAASLRGMGQHDEAVVKYRIVLGQYPDTPAGKQAAVSAAATLSEWATELRETGEYEEAIEKYRTILNEYAGTPVAAETRNLAAETYVEWAAQLRETGEYEQAIAKYRVTLDEYAGTPAAAGAEEAAAKAYIEWAAQLRQAGRYEEAIEKYEAAAAMAAIATAASVLDESGHYAGTSLATEARELTAEAYVEWAAELCKTEHYEEAIHKYRILLDEYAGTAAAAGATEAAAEAYAEWAMDCRQDGLYTQAIAKYNTILSDYAGTQTASAAQAGIGQTYNEWGSRLHSQREYTEAMEKFTLAQEATDDAATVASAGEGYDKALWALSQDSTGEGRELMEQALPNVCEGEGAASPAIGLAEDEPGRALFGGSEFTLAAALKATHPAHFRYAICLESGMNVVQRCPYTGGHTLVRQRQWWRVRVRDTRTARVVADRTFYGSQPDACPFSRFFWASVDYDTGSPPSEAQVSEWLQGVVR